MPQGEERPVLTGLAALFGVAIVVGLILGGAVWAGAKVAGLGGSGSSSGSSAAESLYLPKPQKTDEPSGPAFTLAPGEKKSREPEPEASESEKPERELPLSAGQTEVATMERIDLTGTYPGGEGAILQVERLLDGTWNPFDVTVSVSGETFSTYVQTGQLGVNKFRVRDTDTDEVSNAVQITVS